MQFGEWSGFAKNIEASANEERRTQLNRKK